MKSVKIFPLLFLVVFISTEASLAKGCGAHCGHAYPGVAGHHKNLFSELKDKYEGYVITKHDTLFRIYQFLKTKKSQFTI